ncbi:4Fe-4S binding protein [Caldinitratiruptor microaerophilus]|uniref:4Fe-4S ferredoxin-type domain-containing protein n=1 Tax=Caldinitratiruptor microaerophilus TaxID=671077 RepID=A0AA35GA65_9FIRM|nr:4Fe-4S binding protein [Caldinitratiruptor microaerophilus]BDG62193.1 hypothetical protein caldi_32830 [Caldinitratiruptor microaerophilus]
MVRLPSFVTTTRRHDGRRLLSYVAGLLMFYAPFALFTRLWGWATGTRTAGSISDLCLRMQINWLTNPAQWGNLFGEIGLRTVGFFVILGLALLMGPLFCGWICAAGALPEYLSRLVPDRFKMDVLDKVNVTAIRYGFLAGYVITPFLAGGIGCAFCNYKTFELMVLGVTGSFTALSSTYILVTLLWLVAFGLFMKGGRGWCNFACPVGALQSLVHSIGARFGFTWKLKYFPGNCKSCHRCVAACPMRAISPVPDRGGVRINRHQCILCKDCIEVCRHDALAYGRGPAIEPAVLDRPALEPAAADA